MGINAELKINPFAVKTPENLAASELVDLFVPYPEYTNLQVSGHQFLNGHRGSGKSMMLRMMSPDCQSLERKCHLMELPYFGVYLSIKATEVNSTEYARLEDETSGFILSEHVLITKLLSALFTSIDNHCTSHINFNNLSPKIREFIDKVFYKRLNYSGWSPTQELTSFSSLFDQEKTTPLSIAIEIIDQIQAETARYVKQRSFIREFVPYTGALLGFQDVLLPIIKSLADYEIIPKKPVFFLLDDADNLTLQQTKILNTWVSYRSTDLVSLKISTQMNYKTHRTSSGIAIESPHDYSEINFTSVYTGSIKESYPKLINDIVAKRLAKIGLAEISPSDFFPGDKKQEDAIRSIAEEIKEAWYKNETGGFRPADDAYRNSRPEYIRRLSGGKSKKGAQYKYAGFEQLVHISSGIVRFFLEPAARMYADQLKKNGDTPVTYIDPEIQDHEIRKQSDALLIKRFDELKDDHQSSDLKKIDRLRNVIQALGALFQAHIMDHNQSQRRIFSFTISDSPPPELGEILNLGVQYGYLYEDAVGKKNGIGREKLYVLTRRIAPSFKLDPTGFSNYLSLRSEFLLDVAERPNNFVNRLRKIGSQDIFDSSQQLSLLEDNSDDINND